MSSKRWLVAWVGRTDHQAAEGAGQAELGPIATAVKHGSQLFDRIYLLTNYAHDRISGEEAEAAIRRYSTQPAVDLRVFVDWIFFNLYAGNNDSHAKNLSIYNLPGKGVTLTPFYDLMCTRMYPGLSQEFAFAIGGEYKPAAMTKAQLTPLAQQLGMRSQFLVQQAADLARRMPDALGGAVEEVKPSLPRSAKIMADRMQRFIVSMTRKMAARLAS